MMIYKIQNVTLSIWGNGATVIRCIEKMKRIELTKNKYTIVDDEDFDYLNQYNWYYKENRKGGYGVAASRLGSSKNKIVRMHRFILNAPEHLQVDHINRNPLDNRKHNLRLANHQQNSQNIAKRKTSANKYKGIYKRNDGRRKCWVAQIKYNGKNIYIGSFFTQEDAAKAYDVYAFKLFKEFAYINFKEDDKI